MSTESPELDRVLVVGPIGAGKSFAASRIAEMLQRPLVRIDEIMLDENKCPKPKDRFIEDAEEFFAQPHLEDGWVADGNYRSIRHITWEKADAIGYVRPGRTRNYANVARRSISRDTSGGNTNEGLVTQVRRLSQTRQEDMAKLDETTGEFEANGVPVFRYRDSGNLVLAFSELIIAQSRPPEEL